MAGWKLFMAAPSELCQRSFRRFGAGATRCPETGYHDAEIVVDAQFVASPEEECGANPDADERTDPRWPKYCACGYTFHPEDHWQVNVDRLYRGAPDGLLYQRSELPPGAVWQAHWMEDIKDNPYAGPDGKVWAVMLPAMIEWLVYGPSSDGTKWKVEGTLPGITVYPSISQVGHYHGWIKDGVITPDCEGRAFTRHRETA